MKLKVSDIKRIVREGLDEINFMDEPLDLSSTISQIEELIEDSLVSIEQGNPAHEKLNKAFNFLNALKSHVAGQR